jgi:hypothetical protein
MTARRSPFTALPSLHEWFLNRLETVKDHDRLLVRDPLHLLRNADGLIHSFAKENGFTVIIAGTNLVFRDLLEHALADADVKKILVVDRTPKARVNKVGHGHAPPLFYPDLLAKVSGDARIDLGLQQFLIERTGDPLWPATVDDPRHARIIVQYLDGVIRAHANLRQANPGRFTDHDFESILAYAALGVPESAFKNLGSLDYWKIGLLGHQALNEMAALSPEITKLIKGELRKAPEPFCWFAERDPETVIRAFYLSVILSQHHPQWSLMLANVDPALQPLSTIKPQVLNEAAPKLIELDVQQARRDLEGVEAQLTKDNLQFLLLDQLKLTTLSNAASVLEKEQFSPLFRSLALLVELNDLLSAKPETKEHAGIARVLFPGPDHPRPAFVETISSPCWSDLKQAYRLASEVRQLQQGLAQTLKTLSTITQADKLTLKLFLDAWNGKRLNRLEYFLSGLSRLIEHGQLLPRHENELPSTFGTAVATLKKRLALLNGEVRKDLDALNRRFQELVTAQYPGWTQNDDGLKGATPILTSQFMRRCLKPYWDPEKEKAALLIFDGMRYDIWEELLKPMLLDRMEVLADLPGASILPSETQLTRKAISAGAFPDQFDQTWSEDRLLKGSLAREFGYHGAIQVVTPEGSGTGETVRYRAGNLDVFIFELCDKELHHIKNKTLPDGREVPSRPLAFVYEQTIKNIIDTEVMGIIRSLAPGTKVFITADHGFGPVARERIWFDRSQLNDAEDCSYLNSWLRVPPSSVSLPEKFRRQIITFTPEQLRLPVKETVQPKKSGPSYTKEFRSVAFPAVGFSFSRPDAHYNPDAYSHGGISLQELVVPMVVLKVRQKEEGLLLLDGIEGPKEIVEGQEAVFRVRLRRNVSQNLFDDEVRVDLEAEVSPARLVAPASTDAPPPESAEPLPLPAQVCYVGTTAKELPINVTAQQEQATSEERRAGRMDRVLTVTVGYREGLRTARKSQTFAFSVQLNSERIVRRLGNLGSILGLTPKGMR